MKRMLAVSLALVLLLLLSLACVAATSQSGNVTGVWGGITPPVGDTPVYSIEVKFDSMEFSYTAAASVWNPATHTYDPTAEAVWSSDKNTVAVTNYSDADMAVAISYVAKEGFAGIRGSFGENADFTLESAANKTMATAANKTACLTLSGALPHDVATLATVGSITVAISVAQ